MPTFDRAWPLCILCFMWMLVGEGLLGGETIGYWSSAKEWIAGPRTQTYAFAIENDGPFNAASTNVLLVKSKIVNQSLPALPNGPRRRFPRRPGAKIEERRLRELLIMTTEVTERCEASFSSD